MIQTDTPRADNGKDISAADIILAERHRFLGLLFEFRLLNPNDRESWVAFRERLMSGCHVGGWVYTTEFLPGDCWVVEVAVRRRPESRIGSTTRAIFRGEEFWPVDIENRPLSSGPFDKAQVYAWRGTPAPPFPEGKGGLFS